MEYEYSKDWTPSEERSGYHFKTLKYNDCAINVYRPSPTPEKVPVLWAEMMDALNGVYSAFCEKKRDDCLRVLGALGIKTAETIKYAGRYENGEFQVCHRRDFLEKDLTIILENDEESRIIVLTIPANTFSVKKDGTGDFSPSLEDPDYLELYLNATTLKDRVTGTDFSPFATARVIYK